LTRQATQLAFGDVQLTTVFRRVTIVNALDVRSRLLGRERRVERPFHVRVEVVTHKRHLRASGIACI
jgi:hypothetical protein